MHKKKKLVLLLKFPIVLAECIFSSPGVLLGEYYFSAGESEATHGLAKTGSSFKELTVPLGRKDTYVRQLQKISMLKVIRTMSILAIVKSEQTRGT